MTGIESPTTTQEQHGSSRRTYIVIGVLLAVITLVEWQLPTFLTGARSVLIITLLLFSALKAGLVMAFYMHLKFDSRVYTAVLLLAAVLVGYFLLLVTAGFIWP